LGQRFDAFRLRPPIFRERTCPDAGTQGFAARVERHICAGTNRKPSQRDAGRLEAELDLVSARNRRRATLSIFSLLPTALAARHNLLTLFSQLLLPMPLTVLAHEADVVPITQDALAICVAAADLLLSLLK